MATFTGTYSASFLTGNFLLCNRVAFGESHSRASFTPQSRFSDTDRLLWKGSHLPLVAIDVLHNGSRYKAEAVLVQILKNDLPPNTSMFNGLIDSYCKAGKLKDAFKVFELMQTMYGCVPSTETYNHLLKGLCYVGRVEESYQILSKMKGNFEPDALSYSAVMHGFCKVGRTDEALELLDEAIIIGLFPTVAMFNALLHGYSKEGRPLEGFRVLDRMNKCDCAPNSVTYNTLLHGLVLWGKTGLALDVYKEMVGAKLVVDERLKKGLLRGLCRVYCSERHTNHLEYAYQLFEEMKSNPLTIDHGIGTLMIRSLCSANRAHDAWATLQHMVQSELAPRLVIWNLVIRTLCSYGDVDEAFQVLALLYKVNRMPSKTSYNLLIYELNRQGRSVASRLLFAAALVRGVVPSIHPAR